MQEARTYTYLIEKIASHIHVSNSLRTHFTGDDNLYYGIVSRHCELTLSVEVSVGGRVNIADGIERRCLVIKVDRRTE